MAVATGSTPRPKPEPVHFTEAIGFLRNKIRLPTRAWTDLWQDQHSRAFVVAGAMKDALVADFHEAVTKAIAEGRTLDDFRKDFDRIVATHGWIYKGGRAWRSRVIYNTNMRTAYSAGRWAQIQRLKTQRPYIRYVTMADERVRFSHRLLHNIVLPADHPFWLTYFPPNDWGCRCTAQSLSEADMKRLKLKITPDSGLPKGMVKHKVNTPEGEVEITTPEGIAPGFAYNPGEGAFGRGANLDKIKRHGEKFSAIEAPGSMRQTAGLLEPAVPLARPASEPRLRPDGTPYERALRAAFRRAFGGDEAIYRDPIGGHVSITQAVTDHLLANSNPANVNRVKYWPLVRELIEAPQEIWIGFARDNETGRVALRRRYVRLFDLSAEKDGKSRIVGMVADEEAGYWQSVTVLAGRVRDQINNLRSGIRVYRSEN